MRWVLLLTVLLVAGCGESYDPEAFELVRDYLDEQTANVESAPLLEPSDEAAQAELADEIDATNANYWDRDDWPSEEEIESWALNVTQGEKTGQIEGEDLVDVVFELEWASSFLADRLRNNEDIDPAWEASQEAVEQVRDVLSP